MEKTTLYLTSDLQKRLREVSRRTGRPQADLVREAVATYLAELAPPKPASIGLGADAELHSDDTEEWLKAQWGRKRE